MEEIFLNLIPTGNHPICHASQYDVGRQIKVNLFDGAVAYALQEGDSLVLDIKKPNAEIVSAELAVTIGEVYAYIVTMEQMCDIVGRNECELRLKNGTKNIGTLNFYIEVEEAVGEVEPLPPPTPAELNTVIVRPTRYGTVRQNGITPLVKTENGLQYVNIDYSKSWTIKYRVMNTNNSTAKSFFILGTGKSGQYYRNPSFEFVDNGNSAWGSVSSNGNSCNDSIVAGSLTERPMLLHEWYEITMGFEADTHTYLFKVVKLSDDTVLIDSHKVLNVAVYQPDFSVYPLCFGGNACANDGRHFCDEDLCYDLSRAYIENDGVVIWGNKV